MKKNQRTIQRPAELEGVGLFGGQPGKVRVQPAPANAGVTFIRVDLPTRPRLPVTPDTVAAKFRRSAVTGDNAEIETIEHLMSALGGLEIDNLEVEVNGPELPNLDGSSSQWVDLLRGAGIVDLPDPKRVHVVREPIAVSDNEASIVAMPGDAGLTVSYTLNYPNTPIGQQHFTLEMTDETYAKMISPARTFCLQAEAEALLQQGLGKGGSYQTTVVWGPNGPHREHAALPRRAGPPQDPRPDGRPRHARRRACAPTWSRSSPGHNTEHAAGQEDRLVVQRRRPGAGEARRHAP
jgi:UDP-3-O-acyl N-acetylglucosamine deacetylase